MNRDQLQLSVDALLALAVTEAEAREMSELPSLEEMNAAFHPSQEFERRIANAIQQTERKSTRYKLRRYAKRAAITMAASLALFSCALLPVQAVREAVVETVIAWYDKFTSIGFSSEDSSITVLPGKVELGYVPEGYTVQKIFNPDPTLFVAHYVNSTLNYFSVSIAVIGDNYVNNVDNEHSQYYTLEFDGNQAIWVAGQDENNFLIWNKDGLAYDVSGNLDVAELIRIAQEINFS